MCKVSDILLATLITLMTVCTFAHFRPLIQISGKASYWVCSTLEHSISSLRGTSLGNCLIMWHIYNWWHQRVCPHAHIYFLAALFRACHSRPSHAIPASSSLWSSSFPPARELHIQHPFPNISSISPLHVSKPSQFDYWFSNCLHTLLYNHL